MLRLVARPVNSKSGQLSYFMPTLIVQAARQNELLRAEMSLMQDDIMLLKWQLESGPQRPTEPAAAAAPPATATPAAPSWAPSSAAAAPAAPSAPTSAEDEIDLGPGFNITPAAKRFQAPALSSIPEQVRRPAVGGGTLQQRHLAAVHVDGRWQQHVQMPCLRARSQ